MSYARRQDFEDGQVLMACSICGVQYLFPDDIRRGSDNLFRCLRTCNEQPIRERDRIIAESHKRREMQPPKFGIAPSWNPVIVDGSGGFIVGDFSFGHGSINIPALTFSASDVGRSLTLTGSSLAAVNAGSFRIIAILDAHTVEVQQTLADQPLDSSTQVVFGI